MSQLLLLDHFEAVRGGRKTVYEIASDLAQEINDSDCGYPQALAWIDEAQALRPISITDFVVLRSSIKAALDTKKVTGHSSRVIESDTAATLINSMETRQSSASIISSELASTRINPAQATQSQPHYGVHSSPALVPKTKKPLLWIVSSSALTATMAVILAIMLWPRYNTQTAAAIVDPAAQTPVKTPDQTPPSQPPPRQPQTSIALHQPPTTTMPEATSFHPQLDNQEWLKEIKRRANLGALLPAENSATAAHLLEKMNTRFPSAPETQSARQFLRSLYLQEAEQARMNGEWEQAQQFLDAAYQLLPAQS